MAVYEFKNDKPFSNNGRTRCCLRVLFKNLELNAYAFGVLVLVVVLPLVKSTGVQSTAQHLVPSVTNQ